MYDEVQRNEIPVKKDTVITKRDNISSAAVQTLGLNLKGKKLSTDDKDLFPYEGDAHMDDILFRWHMLVYCR